MFRTVTSDPRLSTAPRRWAGLAGLALLLFATAILAEALLLGWWQGSLPNQLQFPPLLHAGLWPALWHSDPLRALGYLLRDETWLLIESRQGGSGGQIWGLYFSLASLLAHALAAGLVARGLVRPARLPRRGALLPGAGLLLIGATEIQLAVCCTTGPGWLIQVMVNAWALQPAGGGIDWWRLYPALVPWFDALRVVVVLGGAGLLLRGAIPRHRSGAGLQGP